MVSTPIFKTTQPQIQPQDQKNHPLPPSNCPENGQKLPECAESLGAEWVDGQWVEKSYMTLKHSRTQALLASRWLAYCEAQDSPGRALGGIVLTEALCQTQQQKRRPDVAYATDELIQTHGYDATCFPVSFPLVAEVASPDDPAEMLFAKAQEYLAAETEEVWLLYPETRVVVVVTEEGWRIFAGEDVVETWKVLVGFAISLAALFPWSVAD